MRSLSSCLLLVLLAPVQAQTSTSATITNANVSYTQGALPATPTSVPTADESMDTGSGDPLVQHCWFFRILGETRQYTFANDATATRVVTNPNMVTTWPDVASRTMISATLTQTAVSTGTTSGYIREDMTVTNISSSPITVNLYAYTDFDVGGTANDARGDLNSQVVQNTTPTDSVEFFAVGNTTAAVMAGPTLLTNITGTVVYDLPGWTGSFGPGDYTGAVQWSGLLLSPNQAVTVVNFLSIHNTRPEVTAYGTALAGSNGTPAIGASEFFLQDGLHPRISNWTVENGVPGFIAALLVNFNQGNTTLAGMQVQVDLTGAQVVIITLDNQGRGIAPLALPPTPSFVGTSLYGQWFVADGTTTNGIASYSGGLHVVCGHW
jgi:hypothetical protein